MTALDVSEGMLAQARSKPGAGAVRFLVHDLEKPLPLPAQAFDRVLCSLALEHVVRLERALAEMARVCRPDGRVAIIEMHPAMLLKGVSAHFHDPRTGQDVRPRSVGHQVSGFVTAGLKAGLVLEEMREFFNPNSAKHRGWPVLLTLRFRLDEISKDSTAARP